MRPAPPSLGPIFALLAAALAITCSRANRPCPPQRPAPARTALAPADGEVIASIAATGARYEVCPDEEVYLITRDGERELTEPELKALQKALRATSAGVEMSGIGGVGCRPPPKRELGVQLWARDVKAPPEVLARSMVAAIAQLAGNPTARIQVTVRTTPGPRCDPSDPTCGPLPYQAMCIERTDYEPKAPRKFVRGQGRSGECTHDGECFVAGCGNNCVPAKLTDLAGTCEGYSHWENVYCGCVQTACAWFTNP